MTPQDIRPTYRPYQDVRVKRADGPSWLDRQFERPIMRWLFVAFTASIVWVAIILLIFKLTDPAAPRGRDTAAPVNTNPESRAAAAIGAGEGA